MKIFRGNVIQFAESHKWSGCFGFVDKVEGDNVLIGIPVPIDEEAGFADVAYIMARASDKDFFIVGDAALVPEEEEISDDIVFI